MRKRTPAQLRVAIAKDVLKRLDTKYSIIPTKGMYVRPTRTVRNRILCSSKKQGEQAQLFIDKIAKNCQVCAIGSLFLSKIAVMNNLTIEEFDCGERNVLQEVFSYKQLQLIEGSFEGWTNDAGNFLGKYPSPKDRMRAIMKNIVKNKGEFIP